MFLLVLSSPGKLVGCALSVAAGGAFLFFYAINSGRYFSFFDHGMQLIP